MTFPYPSAHAALIARITAASPFDINASIAADASISHRPNSSVSEDSLPSLPAVSGAAYEHAPTASHAPRSLPAAAHASAISNSGASEPHAPVARPSVGATASTMEAYVGKQDIVPETSFPLP